MSMRATIEHFAEQFSYHPTIVGGGRWNPPKTAIVVGMGGSGLAAYLVRALHPERVLFVHESYGLPPLPKALIQQSLVIGYSYSGNTEETIDAFKKTAKIAAAQAIVAVGGKLISLAKRENIPFIQFPNVGIQPRAAVGFSVKALLKFIGATATLKEAGRLATTLKPKHYEGAGRALAKKLRGAVPVIYSSVDHFPIAYSWKIKFNETGKIPAFYNVLPELNHNEMTGFDVATKSRTLSRNLHFLFLRDGADHPRIQRRMDILQKLYRARGLPVTDVPLQGKNLLEKMFSSLVLADWTALSTAEYYGLEPEQVPMVEEFKKLIL